MLIDCDTCELRDLACDDCVVTVLLGPTRLSAGTPSYAGVVTLTTPDAGLEHRDPVELDEGERAALAVLADSGLVPPLQARPSPRTGTVRHLGRAPSVIGGARCVTHVTR